ncbi:MAG: FKBP-type peptidyl-prolyl cis-trans isomerase [Ferruginibacter sp.]
MKNSALFFLLHLICISMFCQNKRTAAWYTVPDSIKAIGFYAEVNIPEKNLLQKGFYGITVNEAVAGFGYNKMQKAIQFNFFEKTGKDIAFGKDVYRHSTGNAWNYEWKYDKTYPLLILTASDSATKTTLFSGYTYFPDEKCWKFISTRSYNDTNAVKYIWAAKSAKDKSSVTYTNRWLLRSDGSWKALDSQTNKPPVLRPMTSIDSITQQKMEEDMLRAKLPKDSVNYEAGMFYQMMQEGTGRLVKVTDTVTVYYKGSLFSDGSVFDQTKDKAATFPLNRLIQGWQTGLAHCRVGGKIRLFIPSGSAYGIRTRAALIPPNSILVFDIEVLDAKEKL